MKLFVLSGIRSRRIERSRLEFMLLPLLGILALAVATGGCGSGENRVSSGLDPVAKTHDLHSRGKEKPVAFAKRAGFSCYQGAVNLGKYEGSIEFQARCKPVRPPERMEILISRSTSGGEKSMPIKAFQRHPIVLEAGAEPQRGSCSRSPHSSSASLVCKAKASHSALIKGRIWMKQGSACGSSIKLAPIGRTCRDLCGLNYVVLTLAQGPPRGC
jgi:hypothetical protein